MKEFREGSQIEANNAYQKFDRSFDSYNNIMNVILNNKDRSDKEYQEDRELLDIINSWTSFCSIHFDAELPVSSQAFSQILGFNPQKQVAWNTREEHIWVVEFHHHFYLFILGPTTRLSLFVENSSKYEENLEFLTELKKKYPKGDAK